MNKLTQLSLIALGLSISLLSPTASASASKAYRQECQPPQGGLVSWWAGNGNARDRVGNNHGTLEGEITFSKGRFGKAFAFSGENDSVVVSGSSGLDTQSASFSLVAWIKPGAKRPDNTSSGGTDTGDQTIVSKYQLEGATPATYIFRVNAEGRLVFFIRTEFGQAQLLVGTRDIVDGNFHHVAAVRDVGAMTLNIFVDGVLEATAPLAIVDPVSTPLAAFRIGNRFAAPFVPEHFTGLIDEVGFYNLALTPAQVNAMDKIGRSGKCRADYRQDDLEVEDSQ